MVQVKFWFHLKISQDHRVVSYCCRMFLGHWVTDRDKADLDLTRRKTEFEIFLENSLNSSTHTALIWTLCFTWLHKRYWKLPGKWKTSCWRKRAPLKQRKHSWMPLDLREMYVWNLTQRRLKSAKDEYPKDISRRCCFRSSDVCLVPVFLRVVIYFKLNNPFLFGFARCWGPMDPIIYGYVCLAAMFQ